MLLVTVRGLRNLRTKFAQPPRPFPTRQPRAHKIKPKGVRTLHKGSRKNPNYFSAAYLKKNSIGYLYAIFGGSTRETGALA